MYLNSIRKIIKGTFLSNPNINSTKEHPIPYYQRNPSDFERSKEMSLKIINYEIDLILEFFNDYDENEEIPKEELLDMSIPLEKRHLKRKH